MKKLIPYLQPKNIFYSLDTIDNQPPSYTLNRQKANRRVFTVLLCVCISLLGIHYLKYSYVFKEALGYFSLLITGEKTELAVELQQRGMLSLASYSWWTFWHIIGYLLLPFLYIRYYLKTKFIDMGWRINDTQKHSLSYLLLLSPILVFIFIASFGNEFVRHYPFYKLAGRSWFDFITWELLYLTQFICLEFFFRGFMLNGLRPAIGSNAVWVMCGTLHDDPFTKIMARGLWSNIFWFISRSFGHSIEINLGGHRRPCRNSLNYGPNCFGQTK